MSIDFVRETRANYVHLTCQGTYSTDALLNVYLAALGIADSEGLEAALVDIRDIGEAPLTTMERFDLGTRFVNIQSSRGKRLRVALVGKEPFIEPARFAETVALNRGAIGKVFTNIDDAVAWVENMVAK